CVCYHQTRGKPGDIKAPWLAGERGSLPWLRVRQTAEPLNVCTVEIPYFLRLLRPSLSLSLSLSHSCSFSLLCFLCHFCSSVCLLRHSLSICLYLSLSFFLSSTLS